MKIAIGSDHAGFELKEEIKAYLKELGGHEVIDHGTYDTRSVDYPDFGIKVARSVARKEVDRGILICGTGIGMSIVAGRLKGVRAALCQDLYTARMSREHNDANILIMGGRVVGKGLAREMVKIWLSTEFEGGRHSKRLEKIEKLIEENM
ncbi:MAG TPA: ribose 5-phosphate isomerase B [Candidatus Limnocylindrales bacterium]|jgi:ribose 5-phosphate isomerase B|nr:ribose 5-phosphate isomerase B [Candidatus Limnocylindrales bacterium]